MGKTDGKVRLADYIRQLRRELTEAAAEAENETLRFSVEEIDVELELATSEESSAEGGWNQWVVLKIGGTDSKTLTQKVRVKLKPLQGEAIEAARESGRTLLKGPRA